MGDQLHGLVKFDVSSITGTSVKNATLRLYCIMETLSPTDEVLVVLAGKAWSESTVNWNSRGGWDDSISTRITNQGADYWSIDVTDFVRSWVEGAKENHGFYLMATGSGYASFASRQSPVPDIQPELIVTVDVDADRVLVIHDNWYTTPSEIQLNFDECSGTTLTKVMPEIPPVCEFDAPTGLIARGVCEEMILIEWFDNSCGEDGFEIQRKTGPSGVWDEEAVDSADANALLQEDVLVEPGKEYFYRVRAVKGEERSEWSNEDSARLDDDVNGKPYPPYSLTVNPVHEPPIIMLDVTWSDYCEESRDGFKIERKIGTLGSWTLLQDVGLETRWQDFDVSPCTEYYYRVCAYNDTAGASRWTCVVSALTATKTSEPRNLVAKPEPGYIALDWDAPVDDGCCEITNYYVYRGTTLDNLSYYAQTGDTDTSFHDDAISNGETYYYRVSAVNCMEEGPSSAAASAYAGCFSSSNSTYADWVAFGKPNCWCNPYQCDGDADGINSGAPFYYRVYTGDIGLIIPNWRKKMGDPTLNPCADIDHISSGAPYYYRVYTGDVGRIIQNWRKKDAGTGGTALPGDCPRPE